MVLEIAVLFDLQTQPGGGSQKTIAVTLKVLTVTLHARGTPYQLPFYIYVYMYI